MFFRWGRRNTTPFSHRLLEEKDRAYPPSSTLLGASMLSIRYDAKIMEVRMLS